MAVVEEVVAAVSLVVKGATELPELWPALNKYVYLGITARVLILSLDGWTD
ncbi:hypothetical protein DPMN_156633 [Dreissena polymorpha]|uniref:Uncharacterized protein n=1 Tax=Dreissena polymorpha TaxID=45954 RepID=A0A9D4FUN9_DREPO|nr:hypothetical protein DPMN_156633 [Dreissena polymorpha]